MKILYRRILSINFLLFLIFFSSCHLTAWAKTLTGQVIKVSDGDTVIVVTKQAKRLKIRLAEIDAPEMNQPYGKTAQNALAELILSQQVVIEYKTKDRYKRIIGRVYLLSNHQDICAEMVKMGHAWVYLSYSDDVYLRLLEYWARLNQRGIWALPPESRISPWVWRRKKLVDKLNP